jgi:hypothetical protein
VSLTPCQEMAIKEGHDALDKALFTTERRAAKFIPILCDRCPEDAKRECASRATSIVAGGPREDGGGSFIKPNGTFGGVFYNG